VTNRTPLIISVVAITTGAIFFIVSKRITYADTVKWRPIIKKVSPTGVPDRLVEAIIWVESRGNPNIIGTDGEIGLMQILPSTARQMGVNNPASLYNPEINIKTGSGYLKWQYGRYGKTEDVVAAYNAGSVKRRADGRYINQGYVNRVMDTYNSLMFT
jgi:soluble lytic murein transglycosylase-like protein